MKTTHWFITVLGVLFVATVVLLSKNWDSAVEETGPLASTMEPTAIPEAASTRSPDVKFTLKTIADGGKLLFQGVGGEIDGIVNPDLIVKQGAVVQITLINADGMPHNLFLPDFKVRTAFVAKIGDQSKITFDVSAAQPGSYVYYCEVPGHRAAGQEGRLIVVTDSE